MPTSAPLLRSRRALRSAAALGAAALATGSLAACASSSDATGSGAGSGASTTSASAQASPAELLRDAVPATTAKGSYHLALRGTVTADGRPLALTVEGDQASSPNRAELTLRAPSLGSTLGEVSLRYRDDTAYLRTSTAPTWYAIDVPAFTRDLGPLGGSVTSSQDPKVLVTALERRGGVQDAGSADVGGTPTRHLRGSVTPRDIAAAGGADQRRSLQELERLAQSDAELRRTLDARIALDLYVQGDGAIRRLAFAGTFGTDRFRAQVDLTDFGEEVDVAAPPASQVRQLTPEGIGGLLMAG